jgi:hypothetical protein
MTAWSKWADVDETNRILAALARNPAFPGKEWGDCHYALIKMLDGACRDPRNDRRSKKIEICKAALMQKKELFLAAPDRHRMIFNMREEITPEAFSVLKEAGFFKLPSQLK